MFDLELWKKIKKEKKLTYDDIANLSGVSRRTIIRIFTDANSNPTNYNVEAIEKALGLNDVNEANLIRQIGGFPIEDKNRILLVGDVVAGVPIEASEYIEGFVYVSYPNPEEYFALRVHGDSMIGAGITEKSILIVHKQQYAESGDIVVAFVDGKSTVKRFKEINGLKFLMPENNNYEPIPITDKIDFYIFGKVVQIRTDL